MEEIKMWKTKEKLYIGLIEGERKVTTFWNGGFDSSINKIIENITIYHIGKVVNNNLVVINYLDLNKEYFIPFNEFSQTENEKEIINKLYDYFIYNEEIDL